MSGRCTIRTGGMVVGRKNSPYNLDTATTVVDLIKRGYQVYLRDEDDKFVTMLIIRKALVAEELEVEHSYQNIPMTGNGFGRAPQWAWELELHLSHLLPTLFESRITNLTINTEDTNGEHPQASAALGAG